MEDLKNIIDSLLFVAEEPLSIERLKKILPQVDGQAISEAAAALQAEYDARPGGFYVAEVAGGYQFRSRPEYTSYIRRMVDPKPLRLSKAAMETLAVIAYKQPIIRADVEHIRGVDCGGVLRVLLERKLVRVLGRKEIAGRPLIYATTKTFLETFDLKDLRDLPSPKEIEEFGKPPLEMRAGITIEPDEGEAPAPEEDAGAPSQADGYEESAQEEPLPVETAFEEPEPAPEEPCRRRRRSRSRKMRRRSPRRRRRRSRSRKMRRRSPCRRRRLSRSRKPYRRFPPRTNRRRGKLLPKKHLISIRERRNKKAVARVSLFGRLAQRESATLTR